MRTGSPTLPLGDSQSSFRFPVVFSVLGSVAGFQQKLWFLVQWLGFSEFFSYSLFTFDLPRIHQGLQVGSSGNCHASMWTSSWATAQLLDVTWVGSTRPKAQSSLEAVTFTVLLDQACCFTCLMFLFLFILGLGGLKKEEAFCKPIPRFVKCL